MSAEVNPLVTAEEVKDLTIAQIAKIVQKTWVNKKGPAVYFGAVPYLNEMTYMGDISETVGMDTGKSVVTYFLSNATTYRGDQAKIIKAELKRRAGIK